MAAVSETASLHPEVLEAIQDELRRQEIDAWLLYDFHGLNAVAGGLLGLPALSRRYFVLIPADGTPVALTHRIEQQPWSRWEGDTRVYGSWRELEARLKELLVGIRRVAMEYSPGDAVPYVDLVPAGVVEMVRAAGPEPVPSSELISAFYSRWSEEQADSHRRAAVIVRETAHAAFDRLARAVTAGEAETEWSLRSWIQRTLAERGLAVGADTIVAANANAANPHYAPTPERHAVLKAGDLVLIDLWGKESDSAIYADQTWMGYLGEEVPGRIQEIFRAVRDAREAAVALVRERWEAGGRVAGYELDDAARAVIEARGYGEAFIHRTGHSIDRELHGSGPNVDNLETRDTRLLVPGLGFSVEPGIYLSGDLGFRSEINVFVGEDGPEVTTPEPQDAVYALLARRP
jgi:Xaa-Pro dipeptidase